MFIATFVLEAFPHNFERKYLSNESQRQGNISPQFSDLFGGCLFNFFSDYRTAV